MPTTTGTDAIVVAVDGSPESDAAIRWAARTCVIRDSPAALVHVVSPLVFSWPIGPTQANFVDSQDAAAKTIVKHAENTFRTSVGDAKQPELRTEVTFSSIVPALIDASKQADMIVVGSRGMGAVSRVVLGSVSTGLLHHARCPVAIVRGSDDDQPVSDDAPVLVGVDGSPASEAATALAFDEASRRGVELVAFHAWSDAGVLPIGDMDWSEFQNEAEHLLAQRLAGWQEQYPDVPIQRRVVSDKPGRRLVEESRHAQLVVVGSHGRGGFTGMLIGSVSSAVAQSAHAPVIVVRGR